MPLFLWVGVNHHGHTVIFACALLSRETEEDYKWAFEKFLQYMDGKKPKAILSDQCASIEKGISDTFGHETTHRYCAWHILRKVSTKLGNIPDKKDIDEDIKVIVYGSISISEF